MKKYRFKDRTVELFMMVCMSLLITLLIAVIISVMVGPLIYLAAKGHIIYAGIYAFLILFLSIFAEIYNNDREAKVDDFTERYLDKNKKNIKK